MGIDHIRAKEQKVVQTKNKEVQIIMKHFKVIIVTVMLGLAVGLLPKASWASDVSVGLFFGIPFPVVTIAPPSIHHPGPGFFIPPPPIHPRVYSYGPNFRSRTHFRDYDDRGYRHSDNGRRDYGKWDNTRGDNDRRDHRRGDDGRGDGRRR